MKLRAQFEGLAVVATLAAVLAKDTLVAITGDKTVDKAGAGALVIGRVTKTPKAAPGQGTVETRFKEFVEIKGVGALAAGAEVQLAAPDGVTGENRVTLWDPAAHPVTSRYGVVWKGGADGAVLEVLTY